MPASRFKREVVDVVGQMDRIHTHRESLLSSSNVQELEQCLDELSRRADIFASCIEALRWRVGLVVVSIRVAQAAEVVNRTDRPDDAICVS